MDIPDNREVTATARSAFEPIKRTNQHGIEYWSARDLHSLLGYERWENFEQAISRAMTSCEQSGSAVENHFREVTKLVQVGSGAVRSIRDVLLSRFACYLTAQNGDPRKPEIASAQAYFADQTRRQELLDELSEDEKRLTVRERVMEDNRRLSQAAKEAGVEDRLFGVFHDAGYKGLYGGLGVQQLKSRRGIPAKENVLDRMGRAELAANDFRITQTDEKLRNQGIRGAQRAIDTHEQVGQEVRRTIQQIGGTLPENLPPEASLRPLLARRQREKKKLQGPDN